MRYGTAALALVLLGTPGVSAWSPANGINRKSKHTFHHLTSTSNDNLASIGPNVVLAPSTDPASFDSLKIGCPRVHRYGREGSEGSEYIMWYHGRNEELNSSGDAPPLSTGRIGKATSLNGLQWSKITEGSASEDTSDVTLGLNKESWWGFDTGHVGLGQVLLPMSLPSVISEGGVYIMYFMGGNLEELPASEFMSEVPENMSDQKVKGMRMKVGVAISQDGTTFGRIEGDDPSGACMVPYDKSMGPTTGADGKRIDVDEELYCAWPDVVPITEGPDDFLMYYSTMLKETKEKVIAFGASKEGFRFQKRGVCLRPDDGTMDAKGLSRCTVQENHIYNENGRWTKSKGLIMYYEGVGEDGKNRVMEAVSTDGKEWTKNGVILDLGPEGSWDCGGVGSPSVIRMDDGTRRMYYTGQGADGKTAIGVARQKEDGSWEREQANLTFA